MSETVNIHSTIQTEKYLSWEVKKTGNPSGGSETILKAEEKLFVIRIPAGVLNCQS